MAKRKIEAEAVPVKKPIKTTPAVGYTLCIPSTVISAANAYNLAQITSIAYQVARTATIYDVSEIVVLDTPSLAERKIELERSAGKNIILGSTNKGGKKIKFNDDMADVIPTTPVEEENEEEDAGLEGIKPPQSEDESFGGPLTDRKGSNENNAMLFATLLQFFVTPPYLAKSVFAQSPFKEKLRYAHKLPKISTLPFMNNNEVGKDFREGLTIPKHTPKIVTKGSKKKVSPRNKLSTTKYVNVGLSEPLELASEVPVNVRVTVDLKNKCIVSPLQAYGVIGCKSSFGYHVRIAKTFTSVFTESSVPAGYTSSIYVSCDDYFKKAGVQRTELATFDKSKVHVQDSSVLLVLGNWLDMEYSFGRDSQNLEGIESAQQMFDGELKVPEGVRIEDAALIALTKVNT